MKKLITLALSIILLMVCFIGCEKVAEEPTSNGQATDVVEVVPTETTIESTAETTSETTTQSTTNSTTKESTTKETTTESTTKKQETTTKEQETTTEKTVKYTEKKETVYATSYVYVRAGAGKDKEIVGHLEKGQSATRLATGDNGWSKVSYNGKTYFVISEALSTTKPVVPTTEATTETTTKKAETTTESTTKKNETTTEKKETTTKKKEETTTTKSNEDISRWGTQVYGDISRAGKLYNSNGNLSSYNKIKPGERYCEYDKNGNQQWKTKPDNNATTTEMVTQGRTCDYCGKSTVYNGIITMEACAHGGCARWSIDVDCPYCGVFVPARTCHTCKK